MSTWARALLRRSGSSLFVPWELGIQPVRGNLLVAFGPPGVGKSLFGLNWALSLPVPSLIVSLDTDLHTQAQRAVGILSKTPLRLVRAFPTVYARYLESKVNGCRIVDLQLTTKEINELVIAEEEYHGVVPSLVVVDNVSNIVKDTSYESYRNAIVDLQKIARMRDTTVLALHHVTRGAAREERLTLHSGQYSGEQEAEIVLGLWREGERINVGVLKNRNGRADPSGRLTFPLVLDHETMVMKGAARG